MAKKKKSDKKEGKKSFLKRKVISKRLLKQPKQITIDLRRKEIEPVKQAHFKKDEIGEMNALFAV